MVSQSVTKAFKALRKSGYFARQNFACCQSCGLAELPDGTANYVFYHSQDSDDLKESGTCHLAWGGDGAEIVKILNANGVKTEWNGSPDVRIKMLCRQS